MANNEHLEQINHIKKMMEENSKFLSLSGLSGVFAGLVALVGAFFAYNVLVKYNIDPFIDQRGVYMNARSFQKMNTELMIIAGSVLFLALLGGFLFTYLKTKKGGQTLWSPSTRRLLINLTIPLLAGGLLIIAFLKDGSNVYVAPLTLVFYGMALLNASKYTLRDIRYLAVCEIILGILGMFFLGYGFIFWIIGFGLLHILYGIIMYVKYERK